uniref:Pectinesterase inhibitor domain-containing protein n=1 Tax=Oryza glumipatula TaxID=40148 RepID=A0A0E0BGX1_9ORYZ
MAASPAMPSLLLLLLLAVLVAAADAYDSAASASTNAGAIPDPNILDMEAMCPKTTDVQACQQLVKNMPSNIVAGKKDARSIARGCIATAWFVARDGAKDCTAAVDECKDKVDQCLDSCRHAFAAVNDALEPQGTGDDAVKVPEDEKLLAIHASLTQLLRGPTGTRRPPLCNTCCQDGSCTEEKKRNVVTLFVQLWSLLDFADAVLEDLYPLTKLPGAKAAGSDTSAAAGSTADTVTSAAAGSTTDKTSAAAGSAPPVVDTAPAPPVTTYD